MKRFPLLLSLLTMGCEAGVPVTSGAPADVQAGEVAFGYTGPDETALVVPVRINGQGPYQFVLDTGATFTCIDEGLSRTLDLRASAGPAGLGMGVGSSGRIAIANVDSLQIGTAQAEELSVCVLDLSQFRNAGIEMQGLLGLNFLKEYKVTLDFERQVLTLQEGGS